LPTKNTIKKRSNIINILVLQVFLEEMLNIIFTEDIPLHVCVFMSRVNVFEIRRVVFINEFKEAV